MIKIHLTSTFCLLVLVLCYSQENKVILHEEWRFDEEKGKMVLGSKISYEYDSDESGRLISSGAWYWDKELGAYYQGSSSTYEYAGGSKPVRRTTLDYDGDGEIAFTKIFDYLYYGDGCYDLWQRTIIASCGDTLEKMVRFYDLAHCRVDSIIYYEDYSGTLGYVYKVLFEYDGNKEIINTYWYENGSSWTYLGRTERERSPSGKLLKSWSNISDFAAEEEWKWAYDKHDNLILEEYSIKLFPEDDLRLSSYVTHLNKYDEENQLIEVTRHVIYYDYWTGEVELETTGQDSFSYYCDGLLKSVTEIGQYSPKTERRYYYEKVASCAEGPVETDLLIFPNPASDRVYLYSDVLQYEHCLVNLYDATGRLVFSEKSGQRIDRREIALGHLPPGLYFVKISWEEGDGVSGKVMKY